MPPFRWLPPLENIRWQKIRCSQKVTLLLAPSLPTRIQNTINILWTRYTGNDTKKLEPFFLYQQFPGSPRHLSQRMIQNGSMGLTRESPLKTSYKPLSSTTGWSRMPTPRNWKLSLLYIRGRCPKIEIHMLHNGMVCWKRNVFFLHFGPGDWGSDKIETNVTSFFVLHHPLTFLCTTILYLSFPDWLSKMWCSTTKWGTSNQMVRNLVKDHSKRIHRQQKRT